MPFAEPAGGKESEMTRVLLCSADPVLVEGLCNSRFEVEDSTFASCLGVAQLPAALAFHRPDVIFLDVPEDLVAGSIAMLHDLAPLSHIILRVRSASSRFAMKALASGVRGVILKTASVKTVLHCIAGVSQNEVWFDKAIIGDVFATLSGRANFVLRTKQALKKK